MQTKTGEGIWKMSFSKRVKWCQVPSAWYKLFYEI